jgi:3'-phosphoadenosine 5'-phosphosulfate sulfotransferase (PAPS reductase)/FAD synthetase
MTSQIVLPGLETSTSLDDKLEASREIIGRAIATYSPYAIVLMFSGGDDSLTAYHVSKFLGVPVTHLMHGITNTGIAETTDFARQVGDQSGLSYIEANAGNAYADYVLRKGFFGVGDGAHEIAYHILKHKRFRTALSQNIRHKKPGRNILLINGARKQESGNRKRSMLNPIKEDSSNPCNIWVNLINDWTKLDCLNFLDGQKRNPVTEILHRSGECLCGTMQSLETRREVSYWFPYWGRFVDGLEKAACDRGFCWKWGEDLPASVKAQKSQEKQIKAGQGWLPMCQNCQLGK